MIRGGGYDRRVRRRSSWGHNQLRRNRQGAYPPPRGPRRPDLRIARPQGRDDDHRRHRDVRLRPNRPGPNRTRTLWLSCASRVSNARAAQHVLNRLRQSVRPRRGTGHLRRACCPPVNAALRSSPTNSPCTHERCNDAWPPRACDARTSSTGNAATKRRGTSPNPGCI